VNTNNLTLFSLNQQEIESRSANFEPEALTTRSRFWLSELVENCKNMHSSTVCARNVQLLMTYGIAFFIFHRID